MKRKPTSKKPVEAAPKPAAAEPVSNNDARLGAFTTAPFGARTSSGSAYDSGLDGLWDRYLSGNPLEFLQQITPNQSASSAYGFCYTQSAGLYDLMDEMADKCSTIGSCLKLVGETILSFEHRFEIDDEEDARAVEVRDWCEKYLGEVDSPNGFSVLLNTLIAGGLRHGFSVNEIIWTTRDGWLVPAMYIHRHPGQFAFTSLGELRLVKNLYAGTTTAGDTAQPDGKPAPPPTHMKFVTLRLLGLYGSPFGEPAIFGLRWLYKFWKDAWRAWVFYTDKFGTPLAKARVNSKATNIKERKAAWKAVLKNLTAETGLVLEEGDELEFISRDGGRASSPHPVMIEKIESEMTRRIIGAVLHVREAQHGSRAQADTHAETGKLTMRPLADALEEAINRDLVRPAVLANFGDGAPVPRWTFDTDSKTDVELAIQIVELALKFGVKVTVRQFCEWFGIEQPEDSDTVLVNASEMYLYDLLTGAFTINELREKKGLPPVPGGDQPVDVTNLVTQPGGGGGAPASFSELLGSRIGGGKKKMSGRVEPPRRCSH